MLHSDYWLYNEDGGWRLSWKGLWSILNDFVLYHCFTSHEIMWKWLCEDISISALSCSESLLCIPSHKVFRKERQFAVNWKQDNTDKLQTLLAYILHQKSVSESIWCSMWYNVIQPKKNVETRFHTFILAILHITRAARTAEAQRSACVFSQKT